MRTKLARHVNRFEVLLLLAALMLTAGLLAAPSLAGAAPAHATSLTASALNSTVTWGGFTIVTGTLMDTTTSTALGGQSVRVEWSLTGSPGSWNLLATVTTDTNQYYTGQYAAVVYPTQLTYYRFNFLGATGFAPTSSNVLLIHVKPALGVPNVPKSAKVNKSFTVSGSLKPQFPAGQQTVTLAAYRYNGHKWVSYKSYKATNANNGSATKYSASIKISKTGKYRFKASTATTPQYSATTTDNSSTVKIK
jgi:hypothetical protein